MTSKEYSVKASSVVLVLPESATKSAAFPFPARGMPGARCTRPNPRVPSGSALPPMRFALLISMALGQGGGWRDGGAGKRWYKVYQAHRAQI